MYLHWLDKANMEPDMYIVNYCLGCPAQPLLLPEDDEQSELVRRLTQEFLITITRLEVLMNEQLVLIDRSQVLWARSYFAYTVIVWKRLGLVSDHGQILFCLLEYWKTNQTVVHKCD